MSVLMELFDRKNFWLAYCRVDGAEFDVDSLQFFDQTVDDEETYYTATIELPVSGSYSLLLDLDLGFVDSCDFDLSLENLETDQEYAMGWWDEARWHPFALRWDELTQLHHHWQRTEELPFSPEVGFLLLAIFVGHGVSEGAEFGQRKQMLRHHYEQLGLFTPGEIEALVEKTFRLPTEPDYEWKQDDQLGWTFSSEYPCYSMRNKHHLDGEEGEFPFADWACLLESLEGTAP